MVLQMSQVLKIESSRAGLSSNSPVAALVREITYFVVSSVVYLGRLSPHASPVIPRPSRGSVRI